MPMLEDRGTPLMSNSGRIAICDSTPMTKPSTTLETLSSTDAFFDCTDLLFDLLLV